MANPARKAILTAAGLVVIAATLDSITLATNNAADYFALRRIAGLFSVTAVVCVAFAYRRTGTFGKAAAIAIGIISGLIIFDAIDTGMW